MNVRTVVGCEGIRTVPGFPVVAAGFLAASLVAGVCGEWDDVDLSGIPPASERDVDFERDIRPILERSCLRCHGAERPKSGFRLDVGEEALRGGDYGVDIVPGNSLHSPLIHYVSRIDYVRDEYMEMPPEDEGEALSPEEIGLLRAWIDAGADWPVFELDTRPVFEVTPAFRYITVDGDERKFSEHTGLVPGWSGGLERFRVVQELEGNRRVEASGRVLAGQESYAAAVRYEDRDWGWLEGGMDQVRRFDDDTGAYYAGHPVPEFSLERDLELDDGRIWLEAGIEGDRGRPSVGIRYEYQYRNGEVSSLSFGAVPVGAGRAVYPAWRRIDEETHRVRLELAHDIGAWRVEDWLELTVHDSERVHETTPFYPTTAERYREDQDQFEVVNALRVMRELRDDWLVSGGYLYSSLDGDGGFTQLTWDPTDPAGAGFLGDVVPDITVERNSHVFNLNTRFGPWRDLTVSAGVQNEWMRQDGVAMGRPFNFFPGSWRSDIDRRVFEEDVGVRYTGLPATVVHADLRLRQEDIGHHEQSLWDDGFGSGNDFMRDTDASNDWSEFRTGFTVSPWTVASLSADYRWRRSSSDFDHLLDTDEGFMPGDGYSAFIRSRRVDLQEIGLRLVLRPASWLRTTFRYELSATDYWNGYDSAGDPFNPGSVLPGGNVLSGNYDAGIYGWNLDLSPWRRWRLAGQVTYRDTRTVSAFNNGVEVAPYAGDTWQTLTQATYLVDEDTDLRFGYQWGRVDYAQANLVGGLPLGLVYDRHGVTVGLRRTWPEKDMSAGIEYAYFVYNESASGNNDYRAHGLFGRWSVRLP